MILRLLAASLVLITAPSFAGLFDDEEARKAILELRQKVDANEQARQKDRQATLQSFQELPQGLQAVQQSMQTLRDENTQLKRSLLDLQTLIEQLRGDLSKQVGQQEQLAKDVSELQRRQRDLAQGVEDRIRRLEPIKVNVDGKEFLADPAEIKDFDAAFTLLRKSDFKLAAQAFSDLLRRYPQSGYQSISQFWLANAQYANRDYREAITNFKSFADTNPTSTKSPEALLAIANSQIELKDVRSARRTLEDLIKLYPQTEAASTARDRLARLR
jgi:tol-pal system protein YbgF